MPYTIQRHEYPIDYFYLQVKDNIFTFPKWQREDCWKKEYKKSLIDSILIGMDIPKFYIGNISDDDSGDEELRYIIDGGHRTRSITQFKDNLFPINIDGVDIFYDKSFNTSTRNTRSLTKLEKKTFDSYHLNVVIYDNISERECRKIFNILQNAQPMSIDDVINSYQSDLVDFARQIVDCKVDGKTVRKVFEELKFIPKPEKSSIMTKLICWWTINFPMLTGTDMDKEEEEVSLLYLTKGNNSNSPCLQYVKSCDEVITPEKKQNFISLLFQIIQHCTANPLSPSDLNTFIHAKVNHPTFSITKFNQFLSNVEKHKTLRKVADSLQSKKEYNEARNKYMEADQLNNRFNKDLHAWEYTTKHGGNSPSGMRKRYEIVKARCLD